MSTQAAQIALVTGVSSGIGQATAQALKAKGYRVFGTSRRAAEGQIVDGIEMIRLDVTDEDSVQAALNHVIAAAGRLDLLVNNAGFGVVGGAEESSIAQGQALFDTNLFGVIRTIRAALPVMRAQGGGRIINISSVLGFIPSPYMALYTASKHALEGYSESLDHELRTMGVRVLLVEPAYTRTGFEDNMAPSDEPMAEYDTIRKSIKALIADVMATADDPRVVAEVVVKAAQASDPKLRYPAGRRARSLAILRRFAPPQAFSKTMRKQMKLDA